ncbi:MFS transporter [Commensalibacter nepenthis]|uniref:MFS transporter n=1 Tax=Commensalibacter nepenthis TaxID=3043872 RepID=A0ABT6QA84_9PROT|nr:MFS transporter [Commensalibacter sp. TBRC 10068]MDI2113813.1 MFS transporter [Commensalibacter sp. TBRC 10068]
MSEAIATPRIHVSKTTPTPFTLRVSIGLMGVLIAVLVSGFNEHVTDIDLADIKGILGISYDEGTWFTAIYEAFQISAMAFAPWCSVTFSLRKFTITMISIFALMAFLAPFMPNLNSLYVLRSIQGFAGGSLPPMLMTVALRYLPPKIKIYGLGAYALTATCGPNLATSIAAYSFEYFGWKAVFWEAIPLSLLSIALIAYGIPQDPLRLERFRQFNWSGLLLGFPAISMIVIGLIQGDRLDWFNSPLICHLLVGGVFLFIMFLINEWFHPLPFFRIQMLKSCNLSFSLISLSVVLVLSVANMDLASSYLIEIREYRPLQLVPMTLIVAIPQLIALPLVAAFCNIKHVDCRWVLAGGLGLMILSSYGGTFITSDWYGGNFYLLQMLQVFGQPMAVISILMLATIGLAPTDGPFVSGMFNMLKGFSNIIAIGLISFMETWREHTHSHHLLDHYGSSHFVLANLNRHPESLQMLAKSVKDQATVLTIADINLVMIGIASVLLIFIPLVATRIYPPFLNNISKSNSPS